MNRVFCAIAMLGFIVSSQYGTCRAQTSQGAYLFKVSTGLYDVRRPTPSNVRQVELTFDPSTPYVRPFIGLLGTGLQDVYVFVGNSFQQSIVGHMFVELNFAAGFYSKGRGIRLGYPLEFRSGVGLGWQWGDGTQLAVTLFHLSNAGISDVNPGLESAVLSYSFLIPRFD